MPIAVSPDSVHLASSKDRAFVQTANVVKVTSAIRETTPVWTTAIAREELAPTISQDITGCVTSVIRRLIRRLATERVNRRARTADLNIFARVH
jgi:hypothetical protein